MYSAVYKCVCKHNAERLYEDLMKHVEGVIKNWSLELNSIREMGNEVLYVNQFHDIMSQYFSALSSIVSIFIYLVSLSIF